MESKLSSHRRGLTRIGPIPVAALAACLLLAGAAGADRPACPPTSAGACFVDVSDMGFFGFSVDSEGDSVLVGPLDEDNDFLRFPRSGANFRLHQIDTEVPLAFCAADPGCLGGGFTHFGTGRVSAQATFVGSFELSCPTAIQVHGVVEDAGGARFDLRAALILVKSRKSPTGCKLLTDEVRIKPL